MKVEEIVQVTIRFPKAKERKEKSWDLRRNEQLRKAIEECIATGKEVYSKTLSGLLYHVTPEFPLIESAMKEPANKSLMKVSVAVFTTAFHLGVRPE